MPLICAFIAVSVAQYGHFLWTGMTDSQSKLLAMGACVPATVLLYRNIRAVGRVSVGIFLIVLFVALWIIITGLVHFQWRVAFDFPPGAFSPSQSFSGGLGAATLIALVDYGGYATVCLCGGEVQRPSRTIPLSIVYAILGVAVFYSLTNITVIGVIPWRGAAQSPFVISEFIFSATWAQGSTVSNSVSPAGHLWKPFSHFARLLSGAVCSRFGRAVLFVVCARAYGEAPSVGIGPRARDHVELVLCTTVGDTFESS
jgi:amino acid transporter